MELNRKYIARSLGLLFLLIVVGVFFSLGGAHAGRTDATRARTVAVVVATRKPLENSLRLSGEFRPYQEVDVHAKVAGYIQHIYVDVGDKVKEGQTLAILEIPELNAQVTAAEADIQRSKDAIQRAEHDLKRTQSSYSAAHAAYTRLKQAASARPGLIAEQELDDSLARDQEAEAQVGSAQSALAEARSQLGVAQANREHYAALESYARITAPFAGVVTKRDADTGTLIQAGTSSNTQAMPVVSLAQYSRLRLVVPVPESAVPDLRLGESIDVRVPSLNRTFKGQIARFSDALSDETRTMHTEIDVENPDSTLVDGMYAETELELKHPQNSLTIPIQALQRNGDTGEVMLVRPDATVEPRTVKLGAVGNDRVEIVAGLSEGDRVIVGNVREFQAGEKVEPKLINEGGESGRDEF
ncbi:MAG: efflux RND transporter periplasmic adaptor subunit [Terriglobales bacterium]